MLQKTTKWTFLLTQYQWRERLHYMWGGNDVLVLRWPTWLLVGELLPYTDGQWASSAQWPASSRTPLNEAGALCCKCTRDSKLLRSTQTVSALGARCLVCTGKVLYSFASAWRRRARRLLHSSGCHLAVCQPPAVPPEQTQRARSPAAVLGSYLARRFSTTHLCCPVFT